MSDSDITSSSSSSSSSLEKALEQCHTLRCLMTNSLGRRVYGYRHIPKKSHVDIYNIELGDDTFPIIVDLRFSDESKVPGMRACLYFEEFERLVCSKDFILHFRVDFSICPVGTLSSPESQISDFKTIIEKFEYPDFFGPIITMCDSILEIIKEAHKNNNKK